MDQRSTKASLTSQGTKNGAVIQSELCGSLAHRKSYYLVVFSASPNHITAQFSSFLYIQAAGKQITINLETSCLGHQINGFVFLHCEVMEAEQVSPGRVRWNAVRENTASSSALGKMKERKIMRLEGKERVRRREESEEESQEREERDDCRAVTRSHVSTIEQGSVEPQTSLPSTTHPPPPFSLFFHRPAPPTTSNFAGLDFSCIWSFMFGSFHASD